jgi:hypothetical protein
MPMDAGVVEQLLQDEVRVFNLRALANSRAIEQAVAKLQIAEVHVQKHVRQEYKHALDNWRLLRTKYVIAKFVEDVRTSDCAKPLQCLAQIDSLREGQQVAAADMSKCVLQDVLVPQSLQTPQSCREYDVCTISACPFAICMHLYHVTAFWHFHTTIQHVTLTMSSDVLPHSASSVMSHTV